MPLFKVKAGTLEGKVLYKEVEAETREALALSLEKENLYPIEVKAKGLSLPLLGKTGRVKASDLLVFNQGFVALLKAGLPVVESLEAARLSCRNPALSSAIGDVVQGVRGGLSLSEAMKRHPRMLPPLLTETVAAGERTGDLVPAIKGYIDFQKKMEAVRKKVLSSITYPAILALASVFVLAFLIVYVVPSFSRVYVDAGADIPLATRFLIGLSGFVTRHLLFLIIGLFAAAAAARYFVRSPGGRRLLDRTKLTLPGLGDIYRGYSAAKFSRTLGMVLRSGIPLVHALRMARGVLNNSFLEERLDGIVRKAKEGASVSEAMAESGLLPPITLMMFSMGERSASLPSMMEEIAEYHDQDVAWRIETLTNAIEPALMIIMGVVVGTIVVLMYLPIFQLGASI